MKRFCFAVGCALAALIGTGSWQVAADDLGAVGDKEKKPVAGTEAYLRRALSKPVSIDVTDKPLDEVVRTLAKQVNVTVKFRHGALDAVGLDANELPKVSFTLHDLPLRSCLRVILCESELTYMVDEGVLIITTPEDAEQDLATAVFDVADLLSIDEKTPIHDADYDTLNELVTTAVAPTTWSEQTGPGLDFGFRGMLVFQQTEEVIDQVSQLLSAIREAKQIVAKYGDSPPPVTSVSATGSHKLIDRIQKALDSKADFEFKDTPLNEVVNHLRKQYRIPMRLRESALDAVGLGLKTKITSSARSGTLRGALRRCLDNLELTYMIYDGVLTITTLEDAEQNLSIRVYPVQDLVEPIPRSSRHWWFADDSSDDAYLDYDRLVELTTQTVDPSSWDRVGGPGSVFAFSAYGLIVISQTEEPHQQIESLYTRLRKTIPAAAIRPPKKPADDELRMVVYFVPGPIPDEQGRVRNVPNEREVLKLITSIIEPESWNKRDDVYAHAITGRVIIRHTNAVHRQIDELASKLSLGGSGQPPVFQRGFEPTEGGFGGGFMNVAPEFQPFPNGLQPAERGFQ